MGIERGRAGIVEITVAIAGADCVSEQERGAERANPELS
jgi:hypothetical protein